MSLIVEAAGLTDVGCVRTNNEDNFGYDRRVGIYVVCDGMGGQAAGEVASRLAVETIMDYFQKGAQTGSFPKIGPQSREYSKRANALASAIHAANKKIYQAASADVDQAGMGSTVVAAVVEGNFLSIAHVGDSRIYLIRGGAIQQLTHDHSLVMEQVRRGLISEAEAEESDMQNIIIRALGSEETVEPDLDDLVLHPDDLLLLASDGLTRMVKDDRLLEIISVSKSLQLACQGLIAAAREAGGDDNITCLLVRVSDQPWYKIFLRKLFSGGGDPVWQSSY